MCDLNHNILINNYQNNTTIPHSVVFIEGVVQTPCDEEFIIFKLKQSDESYRVKLKQYNRFKHLLELNNGENEIEIQYCETSITLNLYYKPKKSEFCVVPVYIVCKNHDGTFDSPANTDNSISSACKKIVTGIKLIQCLLAEKFHENGMSRKTFQLESEMVEVPECRVHYSHLDVNKVKQMKEDELWYTFGRELMNSELANEKYKYVAFLSCTHYRNDKYIETMKTHDDIVSITEAYAALGGGGLAIFGSACLHTWPTTINDTIKCFEDQRVIDKHQLMDDSCYRGTFSGCFATTLGSVCHELCHTFDLGHTETGIMARGFDKIDEEFLIVEKLKFNKNPPEQHCTVDFTPNIKINITENSELNNKKTITHNTECINRKLSVNENGIYFTRHCLILLYYHRWFNKHQEKTHFLKYEENTINSSGGVCIIEIRDENSGMVLDWWDFSEKPVKNFGINKSKLRVKYDSQPLMFVAEDIFGNIIKHKI